MIRILAMLLSVILAMTGCTRSTETTSVSGAKEEQNTDEGTQGAPSNRTEIPRVVPTEAPETEPESVEETEPEELPGREDILVIYTGNVRGMVNDGVGCAGVAALKKELEKRNTYVSLVDCGDATQGAEIGEASEGLYIIDIMNHLGYDLAIPGDHDFDYGMEKLQRNMDQADFPYIVCNLSYTGKGDDPLAGLCSYVIKEYGDVKVAYVGVTTPEVLTKDASEQFDEDGRRAYDMCAGDGTELIKRVQENVDAAREEGADYVILMSHLGTSDEIYGADIVAANTEGIDAILDAPVQAAAAERIVRNKAGENVLLAQMGEKLSDVGILTITSGGNIASSMICEYPDRDAEIQTVIDGLMIDSGENVHTETLSGGK